MSFLWYAVIIVFMLCEASLWIGIGVWIASISSLCGCLSFLGSINRTYYNNVGTFKLFCGCNFEPINLVVIGKYEV
jgi:hypothetical protein